MGIVLPLVALLSLVLGSGMGVLFERRDNRRLFLKGQPTITIMEFTAMVMRLLQTDETLGPSLPLMVNDTRMVGIRGIHLATLDGTRCIIIETEEAHGKA